MSVYKLREGSLQEQFFDKRTKVQVYGGGFANGKTSAMCIRALQLSQMYPGSNGLLARSTYPKLNDTLRREFIKWCPKAWIKSFPKSQSGSNTCTLTNGTEINFRYIAQQGGSGGEQSTSNLLSATYDWIGVDQMEDPEITEKDFDDLMGRLRGMTPYVGDDPSMPQTGPRWFMISLNPTRNWVYKKLIKPIHTYNVNGMVTDDLLCIRDERTARPVLNADGKPQMLISLVEGSTYENRENLSPDFIQALESTYKGTMKERFLHGQWAAYEGLIYADYDDTCHMISHADMCDYLQEMHNEHYQITWREGYDHGLAVPSCYLASFTDAWGNVFILDGYYEKECPIEDQIDMIRELREVYGIPRNGAPFADPSIFRRTSPTRRTIGKSTADLLYDNGKGIRMVRGNNDIMNGIIKVQSYLAPTRVHPHPITGDYGAPHLFVSDKLRFVSDEFTSYIWHTNNRGEREDMPRDKDDHAMDTIKYMLSRSPEIATLPKYAQPRMPSYMKWREREPTDAPRRSHRHRA